MSTRIRVRLNLNVEVTLETSGTVSPLDAVQALHSALNDKVSTVYVDTPITGLIEVRTISSESKSGDFAVIGTGDMDK